MTALVIIEDYDPKWPLKFAALRARVAPALGQLAAAIEHIGSTAVPGLAAKPIIDIDVLLRSPADLARVIEILATLGYEHRGDLGVPGREAFRAPANSFPQHLYVCPPDSQEYRRHLLFRDHLRAHPRDASAYAQLKRELATRHAADREAYNLAKTEFIEQILRHTSMEHSSQGARTLL